MTNPKRCTLPPAPDLADWLACRGLEEELYATALTTPRGHAAALEYLQAARRFFATLVAYAEADDAAARRRARRRLDDAAAGAHLPPPKHLQIVAFLALGGTVDDLPERAQADADDAARSARARLAARNLDEAEQARLAGDLARASSCYATAGELEAQAFLEMAAERLHERALAAASAAVCFFKAGVPARGLLLLEQALAGELAPDDRSHLQELREVLVVGDAPRVDAAHVSINPTAPHRLTSPGFDLGHTERHLVTLAVERLPSFEAAAAELGVSPARVQQLVKKYGLETTWPPPAKKGRRPRNWPLSLDDAEGCRGIVESVHVRLFGEGDDVALSPPQPGDPCDGGRIPLAHCQACDGPREVISALQAEDDRAAGQRPVGGKTRG